MNFGGTEGGISISTEILLWLVETRLSSMLLVAFRSTYEALLY
jgi:hypothetical protein